MTSLEQVVIVLVTRLMTATDLLQVVQTRLMQDFCNKLVRADNIRLGETTCCESVVASSTLLQLDDNNLFPRLVNN
jgi:hypothetical protein